MLISGKIARLFKHPGFVNIDYLIEQKIYVSPSIILNALTRDWRKWRRPAGFNKIQKVKDALDPTFGYETVGSSSEYAGNHIRGSWFSCPEAGTAISITAYLRAVSHAGACKAALYKKADNTLVAGTSETTIGTTAGWYTFNFSTPPSIRNIDYWIVVWLSITEGFGKHLYYDSETAKGGDMAAIYDEWPDPWSPEIEDRIYSVYCTYSKPMAILPSRAKIADITKISTPWSGATTTAGNTVIKTPTSGKKVRVKDIFIWNASGEDRWVGLRFGWTGDLIFPTLLSDKSSFGKNIIGGNLEGDVDETLYLYSSGNLVYFSVLGEEV